MSHIDDANEVPNANADTAIERAMFDAVTRREEEERAADAQNDQEDRDPPGAPHDRGPTFDITEEEATRLIDQGFEFSVNDDVVLHAQGTELGTDLDELDDLGIDHVEADPNTMVDGEVGEDRGDILVALGLQVTRTDPLDDVVAWLEKFNEPLFEEDAIVGVQLTQTEASVLAGASAQEQEDILDRMIELGVDYLNVIGSADPEDTSG